MCDFTIKTRQQEERDREPASSDEQPPIRFTITEREEAEEASLLALQTAPKPPPSG
jgi:hypothetical protein